jgi:hypothetical protein
MCCECGSPQMDPVRAVALEGDGLKNGNYKETRRIISEEL